MGNHASYTYATFGTHAFSPQVSRFPCHWSIGHDKKNTNARMLFFSQCHCVSSCSPQSSQYIKSWVSACTRLLTYPNNLRHHTTEYHASEALDCAISHQLMFVHTFYYIVLSRFSHHFGSDESSFHLFFCRNWFFFFFLMRNLSSK